MNNQLFSISHSGHWTKAAILLICLTLFLHYTQNADNDPPGTYRVVKVFDGDTIMVFDGDSKEKVRLLGIDAPETGGPYTKLEPYGIEAKKRMRELVSADMSVTLLIRR